MSKTLLEDAWVSFSVKGQVVIPSWLRREYAIRAGTHAMVCPTAQGILLKPITAKYIRSLRGSLKHSDAMRIFLDERKYERKV